MKLCCKQMERQLEDKRVTIQYSPIFREYYIYVIDWWIPIEEIRETKDLITATQRIDYCPWCGTKLPNSLRDQYFEILQNEHVQEIDILGIKDNKKVPEEFKSDKWWKKRGL